MKTKNIVFVFVAALLGMVAWNHRPEPGALPVPVSGVASEPLPPGPISNATAITLASAVGPSPAPSERVNELAQQIRAFRKREFWQFQSWTNRLAIETALFEIKALGYSNPADLPHGLLEEPLDFLTAERQEQVRPFVAETQNQIRELNYRLLGQAWESTDVDTLKDLQRCEMEALSQHLTSSELAEFSARHSWEGQMLSEQAVLLSREQFIKVADANFEFENKAATLDLTTDDGIAGVIDLRVKRDQALGLALSSQDLDILEHSSMPGFTANIQTAQDLKLDPSVGDYLWQMSRWMEQIQIAIPDGTSWEQQQAFIQQARQLGREQVGLVVGTDALTRWLESPTGIAFANPLAEDLRPSLEYPPSDGLSP